MTTSYHPSPKLERNAQRFARQWGWPYLRRNRSSVDRLKAVHGTSDVIVLTEKTASWVSGETTLSFHPSLAVVRIKNVMQGQKDVLQKVANLSSGDTFLDATLGFAADAVTASYLVGEKGRVVGLESVRGVAAITSYGLSHFSTDVPAISEAMSRVEVKATDHLSFFERCPDNAFDVVYFDPMFPAPLKKSVHMNPLRAVADRSPLSKEAIFHARRIARRCVLLKGLCSSEVFQRFGFKIVKESRNVRYGRWEAFSE